MRRSASVWAVVAWSAVVGALAQEDPLVDVAGSGPDTIPAFEADAGWELHWEAEGERLHVEVVGEDGEVLGTALVRDEPGSGVERQEVPGRLRLRVDAVGDWRIRVVDVADAGTGERGAPADGIVAQVEIFRVEMDGAEGSERFTQVSEGLPGDVVEYRLRVRNESDRTHGAGRVVVAVPIPDEVSYVPDSAGPPDEERVLIEFSGDGGETYDTPPVLVEEDGERATVPPDAYDHVRWTLMVPLEPGAEETLFYRVHVR